jgi:hypothetical protein
MDARVTLEAVESRITNDTVRDVPLFDACDGTRERVLVAVMWSLEKV